MKICCFLWIHENFLCRIRRRKSLDDPIALMDFLFVCHMVALGAMVADDVRLEEEEGKPLVVPMVTVDSWCPELIRGHQLSKSIENGRW